MMVDSIDDPKIKWLTYLVYLLLTFMAVIVAWNKIDVSNNTKALASLPIHYLTLERYRDDCLKEAKDQDRLEMRITEILRKIDLLSARISRASEVKLSPPSRDPEEHYR